MIQLDGVFFSSFQLSRLRKTIRHAADTSIGYPERERERVSSPATTIKITTEFRMGKHEWHALNYIFLFLWYKAHLLVGKHQ